MIMYTVIVGNVVEGLSFYGPFPTSTEADTWASSILNEYTVAVIHNAPGYTPPEPEVEVNATTVKFAKVLNAILAGENIDWDKVCTSAGLDYNSVVEVMGISAIITSDESAVDNLVLNAPFELHDDDDTEQDTGFVGITSPLEGTSVDVEAIMNAVSTTQSLTENINPN